MSTSPNHVRILLVDDDEVDRKMVVRAFRDYNPDIEVTQAQDGASALELYHNNPFDCILLDYHLPDFDGLHILEELQDEDDMPQIPVIMLTGEDNVNLAVTAMKKGASDFLVKETDARFREYLPTAIERAMVQRRLFLEKEKALASNAAKVEFLSHMSHELRTPLNAIIGFSEMLKLENFGDLGSDKNRQYVNDINNSGQHLLGIINDILELTKIEANRYELHPEQVNLAELIVESINLVHGARPNGAPIINEVDGKQISLTVDRMAIKEILINLLTNSLKFTPEDGTITLSMENGDDSIVIKVADTGIGISEEDLPHIMEPFVQAGRKKMRVQEGTGLGLPLSNKFAEMHGGRLEIESVLEEGTTVSVILPTS